MTVYELIQALAKYPPTATVTINAMHRDRWYVDRQQGVVGVRQPEYDTFPCKTSQATVVEIYGKRSIDAD